MTAKKYNSKEKLQEKILEYFLHCYESKHAPNKAGLCLSLNISRETYSQYRKKYPDTIKRADHEIEAWWVNRLASPAATGAIFYLKNAFKEEYKDRQENDINFKGELTIVGMKIQKE